MVACSRSDLPGPRMGCAGFFNQRGANTGNRVRRGAEHVVAGQLGVALVLPLAAEHSQPFGIDAKNHPADVGQKMAPAHITQGSADEYSVACARASRLWPLPASARMALVCAWPVQSPDSAVLL